MTWRYANGLQHIAWKTAYVSLCGVHLSRVEVERKLPQCRWCLLANRHPKSLSPQFFGLSGSDRRRKDVDYELPAR